MGRKNIMYRHFECNEFEKYLNIRKRKSLDSSEHCVMGKSCDLYSTEFTVAWGRQEMYVGFWWGNILESGLLKG
jgi:hypothetical protein